MISLIVDGVEPNSSMIKLPVKRESNKFISFAHKPIENIKKGNMFVKDDLKFEK